MMNLDKEDRFKSIIFTVIAFVLFFVFIFWWSTAAKR